MLESQQKTAPSRAHVSRMFDRIAHRYDLLNRLLSFGRDVAWRKALIRQLPSGTGLRVLDLATGTADVLIAMASDRNRVASGVGIDPSQGMLDHGQRKLEKRRLCDAFHLVRGDAMHMGLAEDTVDAVTIAFGIRNVADVSAGLVEMHRVLRPGGRALILEFSLPRNVLFRTVYLLYFRHVLPRLGGLISGDSAAYRYLNETVETFPYGGAFLDLMREAKFEKLQAKPLTFGIATLYQGTVAK